MVQILTTRQGDDLNRDIEGDQLALDRLGGLVARQTQRDALDRALPQQHELVRV